MSELRCVKKSPSVGRIDGIINREAPQRRSHKHKGKKDRKGRKEELIKCWIVEFIVHRAAPSSVALARPADPSFYFLKKPERKHCLSVSMATNTPLHGSSQKHSVKWQLLLDLLSNKRSLWACLFITTTQTFTRLFTMFRDQRQGGGKKKSPVNYVCAISFSECVFVVLCDAWMNSSRPGDFEGTLKKRDANTASTFLRARGREYAHLVYVGKNLQIYTKKLN